MRLDQGKIPPFQLATLIFAFIMGSSTILAPGGAAKNNAWLAIIVGALEALVFVGIYLSLCKRFPGKTLVEINDLILGPYLGKVFSIFYLFYFLHLGALVLRNFGDFFKLFLSNTPLPVFEMVIIGLCAYAVNNGLESIARSSVLLVPILIGTAFLDTIFVYNLVDFSNLLPFMDLPIQEFLKASHAAASFPFGETLAFLMVIAFVNQPKKAGGAYISAILLTMLIFVMLAIRNISVLGALITLQTYPSLTVIRLIDFAEIITRFDIIVAINLLTMGFIKVSILYYGVVLGVAQMTKVKNHRSLILPIGILMVNFSLLQFDSSLENFHFAFEVYPYYSALFQFILPFVTLCVAILRKSSLLSLGGETA